jgi:hypothetical protein
LLIAFFIWWIYAIMNDTGVLYRLTKNWEIPLGQPPAALRPKSVQPNPSPGTNKPPPAAPK